MSTKPGGAGTLAVAAATAACGLLLLSGVGPSSAGSGIVLPAVAPVTTTPPDTAPPSTDPRTTLPPETVPPDETTTTTSTTTSTLPAATPIPLSVAASNNVVGAGGVITFEGSCATDTGGPPGPVIVWIVQVSTTVVNTGITASSWTYEWTAPTDERDFGSFTFQFWCGDPTGFEGGYPANLQQRVDMVASGPPPTTTPTLIEAEPPTAVIPETR